MAWVPFYPLREIVEQDVVTREVDIASRTVDRFQEAYRGLQWLLARNPEIGQPLNRTFDGTPGYIYVSDSIHYAGTPRIRIIYTYDANVVTVYGISVDPYSPHLP